MINMLVIYRTIPNRQSQMKLIEFKNNTPSSLRRELIKSKLPHMI